GYVSGWNGDFICINDCFFKGGNIFCGFEMVGMGVCDLIMIDVLGGNFYVIGMVELMVLNYLFDEYGIKILLFVDFGIIGKLDD
ncbi:BamA/TamA family outer membrane protein, partial [Klebsiella pneumoniae]|uniref:BamA/TamA family outer membrane protein n=1 Tax=Klebsiella pneumoniae TaxID=573 RepID=UPI00272FEA82